MTTTQQPESLSAGWRLILAALIVGAALSAVRAAQALGVDGILATAISSTAMLLAGAPVLDLTRIGGPLGRISSSLADSSRMWGVVVGQHGSRVPVTVLVVAAGILAGVVVHTLSLLVPAWLAVIVVVAGLHLAYRLLLARLHIQPGGRGRLAQAITAEIRRYPAAAQALDRMAGDASAQRAVLITTALGRGIAAAIGRGVILWLLALPIGWLLATIGLAVAAVLVAPGLTRQVATRAIGSAEGRPAT